MLTSCNRQHVKISDHLDNEFMKIAESEIKQITSVLLESHNVMTRMFLSDICQRKGHDTIKLEHDENSRIQHFQIVSDAQSLIIQEKMTGLLHVLKKQMKHKMSVRHRYSDEMDKISKKYGLDNSHAVKSEIEGKEESQDVEIVNQNVVEIVDESKENENAQIGDGSSRQSLYVPGINLKCKECDKLFYFAMDYPNHMKVVHGIERPFECNQCDKCYAVKEHLMVHIEKKHDKITHYECDVCHKRFYDKFSWREHCRIHTNEQPYQCKQCGQRFNNRSNHHKHIHTVHSDDRPFQCTQCDSAFKLKGDLNQHIQSVHEKVVNYRCSYCSKGFYKKSNLTKHLRVHTGEKPFQCTQCGKAFKQKFDLTVHERIHSGEKPYECSQCHKTFTRSGNKRRHERECKRKTVASE